jgi:hypothetical protein
MNHIGRLTLRSLTALLLGAVIGGAPVPARADTIGPSFTVFFDTVPPGPLDFTGFAPVNSGGSINFCANRSFPVDFIVSAGNDVDGLGVPFVNGTQLIYAWNFGTGTPGNPLETLSNRASVRFTSATFVQLHVFDGAGNSTSFSVFMNPITC